MKALTICQPYAELIMLRQKLVENRSWPTNYRGPIGIHAGRSRAWLTTYLPLPGKMEFGALVGFATLIDCLPITKLVTKKKPRYWRIPEIRDHAEGPYCWILDDVRRLLEPMPMPGKQGLFTIADNLSIMQDFVLAGPRCRVCGCTNDCACPEGCEWVEPDLCSSCVGEEKKCHPLLG